MSLQEHEKCLLSICFALIVASYAIKSFRRAKNVTCLVLIEKVIPNNTTPTFQEVGGVLLFLITLPLLFKKWVG